MTAIVIKEPNLKKMMAEQQQILSTLPTPPSPREIYLSAPVPPLTSVYHSRGPVEAIEDIKPQQEKSCVGKSTMKSGESPLLSELLSEPSRLNLEVEKTLSLACEVLTHARTHAAPLSGDARDTLARIAELSTCYPALPPPPTTTA
ncbi:uncharacterized protein TM35_000061470 [Trypanosoma theileri]|uniref:Uncharacterized protein n=1 Tax=Trypanosoma theileri TaxID=67003 RepID=A0A1X0P2K5_9TRYP|nr:uncharacterized protein TM35_000061470 [Trypanosoma theileri]ORC91142.1 hypothetical protein TM35_000061470 [Trypanosoma theileri]